ncbi:cellulose synthase catalytic subunit [Rhizobium sp. EC-SD404]|uniref:glycosyltransferase n=1 Tax=Rhizobium sp. EC-SD404 TaxID=2038389 RepID=UPI00125AAE04|nr:cellulose synthase catalytic subunit [Rhizobium sp. EC-SD404]VVT31857.1 Curdlan Synthase [Rhizobium sp. EC-SD404]
MFPPVYLSELASSVVQLGLVAGLIMVLPLVLERDRTLDRVFLFSIAIVLSLRYIWWRFSETLAPIDLSWDFLASWSFFIMEAGALLSSLSAFTILMRHRNRSLEATEVGEWWKPDRVPKVAMLIATYNEDREVLERTIVGCLGIDHPTVETLVLDDGRRDWLKLYCDDMGVRYVRRDDNKGSKAGNINNALDVLANDPIPPDFIAVLDADFVPHRNFIARTLPLFHETDVGLVQTPQHFFNTDPIQHNLGLSRSYPDEQRFFFDHLEPARDAWGIAFCCGTSSVIRWTAVRDIGGFPTDSVTEDFMLTLALQDAGHRTVYLNEALTEGLAPEGLKEYVTQRARWCLGLMQIARSRLHPFARSNLRLRDRWSVLDSVVYWLTAFSFKLATIIYPLLYWYFGIIVVDASVADVVNYFGVYFIWLLFVMNFISRGLIVPIVNDVSQLLGAMPITRAAITGLLNPHGHGFKVTAKGGDRSRVVIQWGIMRPFLLLFALTWIGVTVGIVFDALNYRDAGEGKTVILFWTVYNLFVLAVTIIACVELPRRERHFGDKPERTLMRSEGKLSRVWLTSLTQEAARVRGISLTKDDDILISIRGVGEVVGKVETVTADGGVLGLSPDAHQFQSLLRRFYADGDAPGVSSTRLSAIIGDAARRFSFANRQ